MTVAAKTEKPSDPRLMRTRVRAGTLAAAMKDVAGVVQAKETVPVLANVLLEAADGQIVLTTCDLDHWAVRRLASDDSGQPDSREWQAGSAPFGVTVPAKLLAAAVARFDGDAMAVLDVDGAWLNVKAGRTKFRLPTLPASDFPLPPVRECPASMAISATRLDDMLNAVRHAVSTEETRYYLNGVYLHADGMDLKAAATDGHRLAVLCIDLPEGGASWPAGIVSRRTVDLLRPLLAHAVKAAEKDKAAVPVVTVAMDGAAAVRWTIGDDDVALLGKLIDGTFPEYTRVIPAECPNVATFDREAMAEAIGRVTVMASDKTRCVKCAFADGLATLTVTSPDNGTASEEVPCSLTGEPVTIGFNGNYWREALAALASDSVTMAMRTAGDPALLSSADGEGGLLQVLMPMRVA